jgi:hypothetical protein
VIRDDLPGFAASFRVERTAGSSTAMRILDRWLHRAIRVDNAIGYQVGGDYMPVSPTEALTSAWATCLPAKVRELGTAFLEVIDGLAARGPREEEMDDLYKSYVSSIGDHMAIPGLADAYVRDLLLGGTPTLPAEAVEDQRRLQPDDVRDAFRRIRDSMLLMVPYGAERPQRHFERHPYLKVNPVAGGRMFELNVKKGGRNPFAKIAVPTLTISEAGAMIRERDGRVFTSVLWSEVVVVIRLRDGVQVWGRDGAVLTLDPEVWKDGGAALSLVERYAPRDAVVRVP